MQENHTKMQAMKRFLAIRAFEQAKTRCRGFEIAGSSHVGHFILQYEYEATKE